MNSITPPRPARSRHAEAPFGAAGGSGHVAVYARVSTGKQAEQDLSIPDQVAQAEAWATRNGAEIVVRFVEPGASATDDRRPEFQRMIDAATGQERPFDVVLVHSMSRFFRDQFLCEMYLRKLAKVGVAVVSITQNFADDPSGQLIRKVIGIFDEYQSAENAKHTTLAMKENAQQGFWNGSRPRSATARRPPVSAAPKSRSALWPTTPRRPSYAASSEWCSGAKDRRWV